MKKLIVALMLISTLASCGKENKVASPAAAAPATTNPATTAVTVTDANGVQLGQMIDAHTTRFGTYQSGYNYMKLNDWLNSGANLKYKFGKSNATSAEPDKSCIGEGKWYEACFVKYTSRPTQISSSVEKSNSEIDVNAKIAELKNYINTKHPAYQIQTNGQIYIIYTSAGQTVTIDTGYPLNANPIRVIDASGNVEFLMSTTRI